MMREENAVRKVEVGGNKPLTDHAAISGHRMGIFWDALKHGDIKPEWVVKDPKELEEVRYAIDIVRDLETEWDEEWDIPMFMFWEGFVDGHIDLGEWLPTCWNKIDKAKNALTAIQKLAVLCDDCGFYF